MKGSRAADGDDLMGTVNRRVVAMTDWRGQYGKPSRRCQLPAPRACQRVRLTRRARAIGAADVAALKRDTRFVRITAAGLRESHPHDVVITKEAPNYRVSY